MSETILTCDVDALAREIASRIMQPHYAEAIAALLRRHVAASGVGMVTVEDVVRVSTRYDEGVMASEIAHDLNASLRARAGTAPTPNLGAAGSSVGVDTIPCRVIRRPVTVGTAIRTPKEEGIADDVDLVVQWEDAISKSGPAFFTCADLVRAGTTDVARWCVPGQPWVERQPTTEARAWEAGDVEACVGRRVWIDYEGGGSYIMRYDLGSKTPEEIAEFFNRHAVNNHCVQSCTILPTIQEPV